MIKLIARLWVKIFWLIEAVHRRLWRFDAYMQTLTSEGRIVSGVRAFDVPVSFAGSQGRISIGRSRFGYRLAGRSGKGTIYIQARSPESEIVIGNGCHFNNGVSITANQRIVIGDNVLVGGGTSITDCDWHEIDPEHRSRSTGVSKPVIIGNNVWCGSRVQILKGVTIGDGAIVAAGAVVVSDVKPFTMVGGAPSRFIKEINDGR